uniref:Uncharacterized protein n=1 Tax=Glycine max TaxID=3847 RepID=A0A0R0L939_SOYBN
MTSFSLNIGNFIILRLTPTNYPLWREQALTLAESQDLVDSQEREFTHHQQITYLRKEDDQSIGEHIRTFKGLCDNLAAIGKPVPDKEKVFYLPTSLRHEYETFTTTTLKPPRSSYSELISQLQSHDQHRNWFSNHSNTHNSFTLQVVFYGKQQRSRARVTYMFSPLCQNHIFLIISNQDQQTFGINV